jgi:formylglycine-generating enzyme required for sulfatase activity
MQKLLIMLLSVAGCVVFGATPQLSNVTMTQDVRTHVVTISYTVDQPAVITLDLFVRGAPLGRGALDAVTGACDCRVEAGTHQFTWKPYVSLPDEPERTIEIEDGGAQAKITAYAVDCPPDWMVADLRQDHAKEVKYYACSNSIPGGIGNDVYKTDKIVMRKIPARGVDWMMGSPVGEQGRIADSSYTRYEPYHRVSFTNDYYMAVYETTQGQLYNVSGSTYSSFTYEDDSPKRPVDNITWGRVRGGNQVAGDDNSWSTVVGVGSEWPDEGHVVDMERAIGKFRSRTGVEFDLPTTAQWEFACRAGTSRAFNNNKDIQKYETERGDDPHLREVGWFKYNASEGGASNQTHVVGMKMPNAWGLYDMHGNVWEWVLDNVAPEGFYTLLPVVEPVGADVATRSSSLNKHKRGGSFGSDPYQCRSSAMPATSGWWPSLGNGFRLAAPAYAPNLD